MFIEFRKVLAPVQGAGHLVTFSGGLRPPNTLSQPFGLSSVR